MVIAYKVPNGRDADQPAFEMLDGILSSGKSSRLYHALVDGGVFANNPAVSAYAEALSLYPAGVEVLVVSVGTGQAPATEPGETGGPISYEEAQHWGLVKWARPLLHVARALFRRFGQ